MDGEYEKEIYIYIFISKVQGHHVQPLQLHCDSALILQVSESLLDVCNTIISKDIPSFNDGDGECCWKHQFKTSHLGDWIEAAKVIKYDLHQFHSIQWHLVPQGWCIVI